MPISACHRRQTKIRPQATIKVVTTLNATYDNLLYLM